tara:strand:- start:50168 stop:50296 length:129 start_codon:yes stop_codon:yes gene_type:complete
LHRLKEMLEILLELRLSKLQLKTLQQLARVRMTQRFTQEPRM